MSTIAVAQKSGFDLSFHFTFGRSSFSNGNSLNTIPPKPFTERYSFNAGISVKRNVTKNNYLKLGLFLYNKGTWYRFDYGHQSASGDVCRNNYVEVPLLYGFCPFKNLHDLKMETGLSFGRLIEHDHIIYLFDNDEEISALKNYDVSLVVNVFFPLSQKFREHLSIGPSFSHSVISINPNFHFYNYTYGLSVNYKI